MASCEPVIVPSAVCRAIRDFDFVDMFRIGKLRYRGSSINRHAFGHKVEALCKRLERNYHIRDLRGETEGSMTTQKPRTRAGCAAYLRERLAGCGFLLKLKSLTLITSIRSFFSAVRCSKNFAISTSISRFFSGVIVMTSAPFSSLGKWKQYLCLEGAPVTGPKAASAKKTERVIIKPPGHETNRGGTTIRRQGECRLMLF